MKSRYTHIVVILDRTGSMEIVREDTIGGFNRFLRDQRKEPGDATMTLVQFDSQDAYEVLADFSPLAEVNELTAATYIPRAMTPLLDAIGRGINDIGAKLDATPEDERPEKVIFVILTDGLENASKEFSRTKVLEMIRRQQDEYQWKFVYIGANQDAIQEGAAIGISKGNTMTYAHNRAGTQAAFASVSRGMGEYRCSASAAIGLRTEYFDDEDRQRQKDAGV